MRRVVLAVALVVIAATAGAGVYRVYATEQEFERLMAEGDRAVADDRPFQALEAYSGAIALRPDAMVAHLKRGITYQQRGELDAAYRDLRTAATLDPTATQPLELLGDVNMSLERFERAAGRYRSYLELDDSAARVYYKLGLALYRNRQVSAAIEPLRTAVQLERSLAAAHLLLGLSLREQGSLAEARTALETASQLQPGLTAPREALAALFAESGQTARVIDQLEALVALDADRPARLVALGRAYADAGRHDAAILTLGRAVERFPDASLAYAALGRVWLEAAGSRRDPVALGKAVEALLTAASHSDATSAALTDLGRAWMLAGNRAEAERALRQAVVKLPVEPEAYLHLSTLSARAGRAQDARDALIRYATLSTGKQSIAAVATRIAEYSLQLGDLHLARRWVQRAIEEEGETPALVALRARATRQGPEAPHVPRVPAGAGKEPRDAWSPRH